MSNTGFPIGPHDAQATPLTIRNRKVYANDQGDWTHYSQFLGCGPPLDVLGRPGDIFVDITLGAFGIFVKYTARWVEWAGIKKCFERQSLAKAAHPPLFHPHNEKLTIWCTSQDVLWVPRTTLGGNRGDVFRRHPGRSFISAREMVEETTVLAQKIADMYGGEWKRKL